MMSLWQGLGYNIVVLTAGLNGLNTSVLEAATIDGCNGVQRFFKVVFPMISPTVFFCTVMTIIGAFKVFAQPYFLTLGGPARRPTRSCWPCTATVSLSTSSATRPRWRGCFS